jgi:cytochrome c-type biogenesis protein CcmH/NrfF
MRAKLMNTLRIGAISLLMSMCLVLSLRTLATAVEWQDVATNLMSPACPGRTLLNCTSGHAEQWRELIRQKLAQGETPEQIMAYFVDMRGEEILAAPPKRGFALTAWLFPVLVIINGAGVIFFLTRKWGRKHPSEVESISGVAHDASHRENVSSDPYRDRLQRELEDFTA